MHVASLFGLIGLVWFDKIVLPAEVSICSTDSVNEHNLPDSNIEFSAFNHVENIVLFVLVQTAGH